MPSAITALFTFIENYRLLFLQKGIQPFLTEILRILIESFRNDIDQQVWTCNGSDDPNVLWADWKTKFLDVVNFHAPLRTRRARIKKAPWINSELKKGMRDRHAAKRMIHATGQSTKSCEIQ